MMSDQTQPTGAFPPMPGEPARQPASQGAPPPPVANAVRVMFARAALTLIGLVLTLGTKDTLKAQIIKSDPSLTPTALDAAVNLAIVVGVVVGIIFTVLYLLLALQVGKGKNWARIVTFVLVGLSLLIGLLGLAAPAAGLTRGLGLVTILLDAAIIVLLALRPSTEYFRRKA